MQRAKASTLMSGALVVALTALLAGCVEAGPHPGTSSGRAVVSIQGPITGRAANLLRKSWAGWAKANHITIRYSGSANFESEIGGEAQQGSGPDLAIFSQPGLIDDLATRGLVRPLPASIGQSVRANFPRSWVRLGMSSGTLYAVPLSAAVDDWVFYSPREFKKWHVQVPKTWTQLTHLSQQLDSDLGAPAWCEGFKSGATSGEAGARWVEDMVLRLDGTKVYDAWVDHKIPFSDPRIQAAIEGAGSILENRLDVNAGYGSVLSIATTTEAQVGVAMSEGSCALTHQDSNFVGYLTTATGTAPTFAPTGDYWAFPLPSPSGTLTARTVSGEFLASLSSTAATQKVAQYLSSRAWATERIKLGNAVSPDLRVSKKYVSNPILQASVNVLARPQSRQRFSASALMPAVVGSGTFLTAMMDWINGSPPAEVATLVDGSWPSH